MHRLNIKGRLAVMFAFLLLMLTGLGSFALTRIATLSDLLESVGTISLPSVEALGRLDAMAAKLRNVEARQIVAPSIEETARLEQVVVAHQEEFEALRAQAGRLLSRDEERAAFRELGTRWDVYREVARRVLEFTHQRQYDRAEELFGSEGQAAYDQLSRAVEEMVRLNQVSVAAASSTGQRIASASHMWVGVTIFTAALMTLVLAWIANRDLGAPLRAMTAVMTRLANGEFTADVPAIDRHDEIGRMAQALLVFKEKLEHNQRLEAEAKEGDRRLAALRKAEMDRLADEFESSVMAIVEGLSTAAARMQSSARSLSAVAERSEQRTNAASVAAKHAAGNVQTVSIATSQLSGSIAEIGRQVERSARTSKDAVEEAQRVDSLVASLAEAAARIGDVVELINRIARQTNLLALNATIEAARAGDAGKGFAVVAGEVKNLANQTAKATDEIGAQIAAVQDATREAVSAIQSITGTIGQLNDIATAIASAVEEQGAATSEIARNIQEAAAGTGDVTQNVVGVGEATTATSDASREVLSAAEDLSGQAQHLREDVHGFIAKVRAG